MNENLDIFSKKIWDISKQNISILAFEQLATEIRNYVSEVSLLSSMSILKSLITIFCFIKAVWALIVQKYNLLEEFQKLKYMFLLGRGELIATFLETSKHLLNKQVDSNFEYSNIRTFFRQLIGLGI
jgi:hypothetical protein